MNISVPIKLILAVISISGAVCLAGLFNGCVSTTPVTIAAKTEGVTITAVNAAMFSWRDWVVAGNATQNQVDAVKTAYGQYLQSQLVASNAFVAYFKSASDSTNTAKVALDTVLQTATSSQTNLLWLIQSFKQGK